MSFMLSPGNSLDSSTIPMKFDVQAGFFNPTYLPSLLLRTIGSWALAGLFAMVLVNISRRYNQQQRNLVTRQAGKFLVPFILLVPVAVWFFWSCPALAIFYLKGGAIAMVLLFVLSVMTSALIGLYSYGAIIICRRSVNLETALLLLALALIATGSSEFVREGLRKPYLIWGHVYSNGLVKEQIPLINEQLAAMDREQATVLKFFPWSIQPEDAGLSDDDFLTLNIGDIGKDKNDYPGKMIRGKWIFDGQCLRCHCVDGYNAIRPLVYNWSPQLINQTNLHLDTVKPAMPPFVGTIRDRQDLTYYMHGLSGACSICHEHIDDEGILAPEQKAKTMTKRWEQGDLW